MGSAVGYCHICYDHVCLLKRAVDEIGPRDEYYDWKRLQFSEQFVTWSPILHCVDTV